MQDLICPHCKNPIYEDDALLCHFCGESLNRKSSGLLGMMRSGGVRWIWVTVAVMIALAFVLSFVR